MQTSLDNRKKATIEFPRSVLKRTTRTEEGGALGSGIKSLVMTFFILHIKILHLAPCQNILRCEF